MLSFYYHSIIILLSFYYHSIMTSNSSNSSTDSIRPTDSIRRTDFQNVTEFNRIFGNKTYTKPRLDIFESDPKTVLSCLALINEEHKELNDAIKAKDFTETIDALADLIVVIGGMACIFGIDLDAASEIVHKSNMSKLCTSEDEAKKTVQWYLDNEKRYDSPYYELAVDGVHYVVRNKSTGKILKNINYVPANFTSLTGQ